MKRSLKLALGSAVLATTLLGATACASYDDGYRYRGHHGPRVAVGYYDGWYDGYYGPVRDGYWQGDSFYYTTGRGGWIVDSGNHFRRDRFDGGRSFHYRGRH
jgi:hypothetical protein